MKTDLNLYDDEEIWISEAPLSRPFKTQLLKWIGNKQKFAHEIIEYFPKNYGTYFEPFLGSGAVLGTLAPENGVGSDIFLPLIQIFQTLQSNPALLKDWYRERWNLSEQLSWESSYLAIRESYNQEPNGADLLYLCRSCYGGVVRFRKKDGFMSTPCGVHIPISPDSFSRRVDIWHERTKGTNFRHLSYEESLSLAKKGDLVYCDPPYLHSQTILYGAQNFSLVQLFEKIEECKSRGVHVVLSIDGTKHSGTLNCDLNIPKKLFARQIMVNCGRSMLKRFQMTGETLENEEVSDRLLLTY